MIHEDSLLSFILQCRFEQQTFPRLNVAWVNPLFTTYVCVPSIRSVTYTRSLFRYLLRCLLCRFIAHFLRKTLPVFLHPVPTEIRQFMLLTLHMPNQREQWTLTSQTNFVFCAVLWSCYLTLSTCFHGSCIHGCTCCFRLICSSHIIDMFKSINYPHALRVFTYLVCLQDSQPKWIDVFHCLLLPFHYSLL